MKIKFNNERESLRWVAKQNENNNCYEVAEKLYREAGDEESADRCIRMRMKHFGGASDPIQSTTKKENP